MFAMFIVPNMLYVSFLFQFEISFAIFAIFK